MPRPERKYECEICHHEFLSRSFNVRYCPDCRHRGFLNWTAAYKKRRRETDEAFRESEKDRRRDYTKRNRALINERERLRRAYSKMVFPPKLPSMAELRAKHGLPPTPMGRTFVPMEERVAVAEKMRKHPAKPAKPKAVRKAKPAAPAKKATMDDIRSLFAEFM